MKTRIIILALALGLSACATMGPNDGLVPSLSAQANLPFTIPLSSRVGAQAAPVGAVTGVYPLNETRKAYWSAP